MRNLKLGNPGQDHGGGPGQPGMRPAAGHIVSVSQGAAALAGGALVGLALLFVLVASGRPVGVSGVLGGFLGGPIGERAWRGSFLIGLVIGGGALSVFAPRLLVFTLDRSLPAMLIAGLLVGFGSRLGNGCTSGHGVCGLARLSPRSLVATAVFIAAGAATVLVVERLFGAHYVNRCVVSAMAGFVLALGARHRGADRSRRIVGLPRLHRRLGRYAPHSSWRRPPPSMRSDTVRTPLRFGGLARGPSLPTSARPDTKLAAGAAPLWHRLGAFRPLSRSSPHRRRGGVDGGARVRGGHGGRNDRTRRL